LLHQEVSANRSDFLLRRRARCAGSTPLAERIKAVLNSPIEYRERGRTKLATYRELSLKMLVDRAISGDLSAAELALNIVARAERYGDPGVDPILVENWIADYLDQTANQKTADLAAARDATFSKGTVRSA
jgi:hypothetical protein